MLPPTTDYVDFRKCFSDALAIVAALLGAQSSDLSRLRRTSALRRLTFALCRLTVREVWKLISERVFSFEFTLRYI